MVPHLKRVVANGNLRNSNGAITYGLRLIRTDLEAESTASFVEVSDESLERFFHLSSQSSIICEERLSHKDLAGF